ncbi:mediator of DNA damage checkpoint protein 1 [Alosa pseudoharengus]|uniref:mediator of DNA damage checkpoint protein 1 n=1 Tax=Alosa pseudoharengus TaxID=34774 RepID=UPI003F8A9D7E
MDATQVVQDFPFDDDEEEEEDDSADEEEAQPVAKLKVFKNVHVPETELLLYPGENILGRDATFCTVPLPASSMSKRHATISISVFRSNGQHASGATEALIWDMGSLNGTRKGRLKLTPHVRYALSEGDKVTLADLPCQYAPVGTAEGETGKGRARTPDCLGGERGEQTLEPQGDCYKVKLRTETHTEAVRAVERAANGERGFLTPSSGQHGDAKPRGSHDMSARLEQKDQSPAPLVPESDSESDGEREGRRPRATKTLVSSDSDSPRMPQPTCSTFQSPSGTSYIPESPSSSVRGRVNETVSSGGSIWTDRSTEAAQKKPRPDPLEFNMDSDTDVEGEEEKGEGEGRSSPHAANGEASADLVGASAGPATKHPDYHIDRNTDVEGDDHEVSDINSTKASVCEVGENVSSPAAVAAAATAAPSDFHLESDTDVEDEDEVGQTVQVAPPPAHPAPGTDVTESRPANAASAEFHMDSDTDVEDEGDDQADVSTAGSTAASTAAQDKPEEPQTHSASDTTDDDDPFKSGSSSNNTEACAGQQPISAAALEIQSDSDTDVEDESAGQQAAPSAPLGSPRRSGLQPTAEAAPGAPESTAGAAESDQDTDVEEGTGGGKQPASPPAVTPAKPDDFNMDSDTDVEEELLEDTRPRKPGERASAAALQSSTPMGAGLRLEEMETQLFLSPADHFARPVGLPPFNPAMSSDDDFVPETQSFVAKPHGGGAPPGLSALDETALEEETQLFCVGGVTERSAQLQLSLSDSSRLQQQLATEATQAYALPEIRGSDSDGDSDLDATQDYGALQATQAYAAEPVRDEEDGHDDSATAETQAFFIAAPRSTDIAVDLAEATPLPQREVLKEVAGPGEEEEEATQLTELDTYSHISTADTVILPRSQRPGGEEAGRMSDVTPTDLVASATAHESKQANVPAAEIYMDSDTDVEEEKDGGLKEPRPTTAQIKAEEVQLHSDSDSADIGDDDPFKPGTSATTVTSTGGQASHTTASVSCSETQPMSALNDDDDEEEESKVAPSRRKSRARRGQGCHDGQPSKTLLIAETQPVNINDDDDGDAEEEASKPASPKRSVRARRGKRRPVGDEVESAEAAFSSCLLSTAQTQPMTNVDEEDEEEEEEAKPVGPRRRGRTHGGRGAQVEDGPEVTETLVNSDLAVIETQPVSAFGDENGQDKGEQRPASARRRGRARRGKGKQEEDESKPAEMPSSTCLSTAETQPMAACEEEEEEDTQAAPSTSRAKTRGAGKEHVTTRSTRGRGKVEGDEREGEEVEEGTSVESRRQTRGKTPAVKRGGLRRGEGAGEEEEEAEEKPVQEVRRGRGRKSVVQQREEQEERERLERVKDQQEKEKIEREQKEQEEKLEREEKERQEKERLERERREERERLEKERLERERREERERLEKERKEKEEREKKDKEENERKEQEEKNRLEKERLEKERQQKEKRERIEKERKEAEERERIEREQREKEERERKEQEEKERLERERLEKKRQEKEEKEKVERERREKEERERKEQEEKKRLERERLEKKRQEKEERERLEREKREKEQRERKEAEEKERLEKERLKKERQEKEEKEKVERERREKEEKERKEAEERERLEKERLEKERKEAEEEERLQMDKRKKEEREQEKRETSDPKMEKPESDDKPQTSTRGRRAASRRTAPAPPSGQEEPVLPSDDCPARRTRSRSSSSNSVSSERSTSSVRSSASRQGAPEPHASSRRSSRRAPPAGEQTPTLEDGSSESQSGRRSRRPSTSSNSVCSEVTEAASVASQSKGRGRGRGRKSVKGKDPGPVAEPEPAPSETQGTEPSATKTSGRGRRGRKSGAGDEATVGVSADDEDKPAEEEAGPAPRGRRGAIAPKPDSVPQKGTGRGRGRGRKAGPSSQSTSAEEDSESADVASADVSSTASQGRGKKRSHDEELEELDETEEVRFKIPHSKGKLPKGHRKAESEDAAGGVELDRTDEETAPGPAERKGRGRPSVAQKKKEVKKEVEESEEAAAAEPDESSAKGSRKRSAAAAQSPTPTKSARRSVSTSRQAHKVLFTGVSDEAAEAVVARLGGSMAKGVSDMTHLVTDAVRRTVKFMCAVARGVPIVTLDWLKKCGRAGSFLPADEFLVKDTEQERKFNFRLQESLSVASSQPLLQGYEIHVTRSVKPEPAQMKDIIVSCGARYLPKMPSVNKPQTVVVSCAEDAALCSSAVAASIPVVSSEFLLTGILQQQADVLAHALTITQAPARGRKKT